MDEDAPLLCPGPAPSGTPYALSPVLSPVCTVVSSPHLCGVLPGMGGVHVHQTVSGVVYLIPPLPHCR